MCSAIIFFVPDREESKARTGVPSADGDVRAGDQKIVPLKAERGVFRDGTKTSAWEVPIGVKVNLLSTTQINFLQYNTPMWFFFAVLASVVWGLSYVLNGELFKSVSVLTVVAIQTFFTSVIFAAAALLAGVFKHDLSSVLGSNKLMWLMGFGILALCVAELGIGYSIQGKSATLAGLIEISYPLFIALFAYFLFGESQLTLASALGGALIFAGVAVIYVSAR